MNQHDYAAWTGRLLGHAVRYTLILALMLIIAPPMVYKLKPWLMYWLN